MNPFYFFTRLMVLFTLILGVACERPNKRTLLTVRTNIEGAAVYLDGIHLGETPFPPAPIFPGRHAVKVKKKGFMPYFNTLTFKKGRTSSLNITLTPLSNRLQKAALTVEPDPAQATVIFQDSDAHYYDGIELTPGSYRLEVSHPGYAPLSLKMTLDPGSDKTVRVHLTKSRPRKSPDQGSWTDPLTGMEFVHIPAGCYQMGCVSGAAECLFIEKPVHEVCIKAFYLGKYEVTNDQYRKIFKHHNSRDYHGKSLNADTQPVVFVSWEEAQTFIRKLNAKSRGHYRFRLPTEAEWEYACRAGTQTQRFWGQRAQNACQFANVATPSAKSKFRWEWGVHHCEERFQVTAPVGHFKPNPFGLHDMLGNVWEWCADVFSNAAYNQHSHENPWFNGKGVGRVGRGGSFMSPPHKVRSAYRYMYPKDFRRYDLGFRLIRE